MSTESVHYEIKVPTGGVSDPLFVDHLSRCTVTVIPSGGTALCQYSTSSRAKIQAGTANWVDWPGGQVSVPTSDAILYPVMALRGKGGVGATLEVLGHD